MIDRAGLLRFVTYAGVGAVGTAVQYAFLIAAVSVHWLVPVVATMIGATLGAMVNYALNARFTFHGAPHRAAIPKFAVTAFVGIVLSGLLMKVLPEVTHWNYLVCQMLATLTILLSTYFINRHWTFRPGDEQI